MDGRTYRYRSFGHVFAGLFLLVWSVPWMYFSFTNRQPVRVDQADGGTGFGPAWITYIIGLIGIPIFYGGIRLLGIAFFERILVADGYVTWFDWKGVERVRSPLSQVVRVSTPDGFGTGGRKEQNIDVKTLEGSFAFMPIMRNSDELIATLQQAAASNNLDDTRSNPIPAAAIVTYNYRSSGIFVLFIFMAIWTAGWSGFWLSGAMPGPIALFAIPTGIIAVWTLLIIVNERVILEHGTLIYRDCFGRRRLVCPLSEIRSVSKSQTAWGSGGGDGGESRTMTIYKIHTSVGSFRFSEMLKNAADLRDRLTALAESNPRTIKRSTEQTYTGWNPSSYGQLAVGLILLIVGVGMMVGGFLPGNIGVTIGPMQIAFGILWCLAIFWAANQKIELTSSEIIVQDAFGKEKLRASLADITHVDDSEIKTPNGVATIPRIFQDRQEITRQLTPHLKSNELISGQ